MEWRGVKWEWMWSWSGGVVVTGVLYTVNAKFGHIGHEAGLAQD